MPEWVDQRDISRLVRERGGAQAEPEERLVEGRREFLDVEDGLFCSLNEWRSHRAFEERFILRNSIGVQFVQTGSISQSFGDRRRYVHTGARVCLTTFPGEIRQRRHYGGGLNVRYIGAWVDPELLVDKFGADPDVLPSVLRAFFRGETDQPSCMSIALAPRIWMAVDAIFANGFKAQMRETYLKAKITELICETIATLSGKAQNLEDGKNSTLSFREHAAIETAALIYTKMLHAPPRLDELAGQVGLNRNKLTAGFQSLFGCTPHSYSKQRRMDWARRLLEEGAMCLQEVAQATGYSTQAAFSRAFADHFGLAPSEARSRVAS